MFGEILLTLVIGAAIAMAVFFMYFNKEEEDTTSKDVKKKKKGGGGKNKNKQKQQKQKQSSSNKKKSVFTPMSVKNKPKIKLNEYENLVSIFRAHTNDITGVCWHESGKYLLTSSKDKFIYIYENPTKPQNTSQYIGSVKAQDGGYFSALSTISKRPIDDDYNHQKKKKHDENDDDDFKDGDKVLERYDDIANSVFAATNNGYGFNSYLLKFAATTHKIRFNITSNIQTEYKEDMQYIAIHPDLLYGVVSAKHDTKIFIFDILAKQRQQKNKKIKINAPTNKNKKNTVSADKSLQIIDGGQFVNYQMCISPNGNYLSIGTFKKDIRIWKVNWIKPSKRAAIQKPTFESMEVLTSMTDAHDGAVTSVQFSNNSNYLISGSKDCCIKVWDIANVDYERGEKIKLMMETKVDIKSNNNNNKKKIGISQIIISDEEDALAVLDDNKKEIFVYHLNYEKKKIKFINKITNILFNKKQGEIKCVKFSPNCRYIAVGTNEMDVRVYNTPTQKHKSKK